MAKDSISAPERDTLADANDLKRIIGDLDDAKVLDILALRPTILDVEKSFMWLSGDTDVFGAGEPLGGVAGDIIAILTTDEEEEQTRSP